MIPLKSSSKKSIQSIVNKTFNPISKKIEMIEKNIDKLQNELTTHFKFYTESENIRNNVLKAWNRIHQFFKKNINYVSIYTKSESAYGGWLSDPDENGNTELKLYVDEKYNDKDIDFILSHEIGHSLWRYISKNYPESIINFKKASDKEGALTWYSKIYFKTKNREKYYDENFAEAFKLFSSSFDEEPIKHIPVEVIIKKHPQTFSSYTQLLNESLKKS